MARNLTNKQLQIVVDEIFNKVSQPIIDENNKKIEKVILPEFQYFKDLKEYNKINKQIKKLEGVKTALQDKYYKKEYEGFSFGWSPFSDNSTFESFKKKKLIDITKFPSRNDIEKQVILAGNRDIPLLIEEIINKLK